MEMKINEELLAKAVDYKIRPVLIDQGNLANPKTEGFQHQVVIPKAHPLLKQESLRDDPISSVIGAINASIVLLGRFQLIQATDFLKACKPADVRDRTLALLYGEGSIADRGRVYFDWSKPHKTKGEKTIGVDGTVISYLLAMSDPKRHAFCKPMIYRQSAEVLLGEEQIENDAILRIQHCTDFYSAALELFQTKHNLPFTDLMHCHLAFFVVDKYDEGPTWNNLAKWSPDGEKPPVNLPETNMPKTQMAQNLILYGPPGTGKTYQVVDRAVRIVEPEFTEERTALNKRFNELLMNGRIGFITFHQSYSYEDFIEGIRPVLDNEEEGAAPGYECRPGIFKRLAINALFDCLENADAAKRVLPFDLVWKALLTRIESEPETKYPGLTEKTSYQLRVTPRGNLEGNNVVSNTRYVCARRIVAKVYEAKRDQDSITAAEVSEINVRGCHSHVVAAVFNELKRIANTPQFKSQMALPKQAITVPDEDKADAVQHFLNEGERSGYRLKPPEQWNRYVLVIDEINRGNISKILGELITLLEPDKRLACENGLIVTLPYSGDRFAVPANLYVLATMNTADKSIALVDLALRRRFEFEELRFDLSVCKGLDAEMRMVLKELNQRIALRKDRDHQIGHAYFVHVDDEEKFNACFRRQIIPLLQEYFYNDWDGLRYVLSEPTDSRGCFILESDGADAGEARTKWQWCEDEDLNCLQSLLKNQKSNE